MKNLNFAKERPSIVAILRPSIERTKQRFVDLQALDIEVCDACDDALCEHTLKSLHEMVENRSRQLILDENFIEDCTTVFIQNLRDELLPDDKARIFLQMRNSKELHSSSGDEDVHSESDEIISPKKAKVVKTVAKPAPISKSAKAVKGMEKTLLRPARVQAAVAQPPARPPAAPRRVVAPPPPPAPVKQIAVKQTSAKVTKKRDRAPSPVVAEAEEIDDTQVEVITNQTYQSLQRAKALVILGKMRDERPEIQKIIRERRPADFPGMETPDAKLATPAGFLQIMKTGQLAIIFSEEHQEPVGASLYIQRLSKLSNWFSLVKKCYAFVGLEKFIEDAVRAEGGKPMSKFLDIRSRLVTMGVRELPKYATAQTYAQLGKLLMTHPGLLYQVQLVTFSDWSNFILEKKRCVREISERRLVSFINEIFNDDVDIASFWRI